MMQYSEIFKITDGLPTLDSEADVDTAFNAITEAYTRDDIFAAIGKMCMPSRAFSGGATVEAIVGFTLWQLYMVPCGAERADLGWLLQRRLIKHYNLPGTRPRERMACGFARWPQAQMGAR